MENSTTPQDSAAMPPASDGSVQVLAWGVMPGDNLPLWRCSSKRQAEAVVVWLRKQRPASTPQAVPLVDGRHSPTLTDAERGALKTVLRRLREDYFAGRFSDSAEIAAVIDGLLERLGGER